MPVAEETPVATPDTQAAQLSTTQIAERTLLFAPKHEEVHPENARAVLDGEVGKLLGIRQEEQARVTNQLLKEPANPNPESVDAVSTNWFKDIKAKLDDEAVKTVASRLKNIGLMWGSVTTGAFVTHTLATSGDVKAAVVAGAASVGLALYSQEMSRRNVNDINATLQTPTETAAPAPAASPSNGSAPA